MTREEEIKQAASAYTVSICNECSAKLYCDERNKKCIECREQTTVFVDGIKWADENPKNVWHDASEEPKEEEFILLEVVNTLTPKNEIGYYVEYSTKWIINSMKTKGFKCRWAYISDLLPTKFLTKI